MGGSGSAPTDFHSDAGCFAASPSSPKAACGNMKAAATTHAENFVSMDVLLSSEPGPCGGAQNLAIERGLSNRVPLAVKRTKNFQRAPLDKPPSFSNLFFAAPPRGPGRPFRGPGMRAPAGVPVAPFPTWSIGEVGM